MKWRVVDKQTPKDEYVFAYSPTLKWQGLGGRVIAFQHSDFNGNKGVWTQDGRSGPLMRPAPTHWQPLPTTEGIEK